MNSVSHYNVLNIVTDLQRQIVYKTILTYTVTITKLYNNNTITTESGHFIMILLFIDHDSKGQNFCCILNGTITSFRKQWQTNQNDCWYLVASGTYF